MKSRYGMDLTNGPVFKKLLIFVVPIVLSGILQQLYNAADTVVVGRFAGDTALAAVGATTALTSLILNLFLGLSVGANVVCARYFGAGNAEKLQRAVHTSVLLSVCSGAFMAVLGLFITKPMLALMGTPAEVIDGAALYMKVIFLGAPVSLLYNFGAGILRAGGDTKRPLYILFAAGLINVALNVFCVVVLKLGVLGVALGTVASQLFSAICVVIILMRSENAFKLRLNKLRFFGTELWGVVKIGLPAGLNGVMYSISNVIVQSTINSFGKVAIAGNTASMNVEVFLYLVLTAVEQGIVSFTAQNMGARKPERISASMRAGLVLACIWILALSAPILPNMEFFLGIFTTDKAVIAAGAVRLEIFIITYLTYVPSMLYGGCLRGMGYSTTPVVLNAIFVCASRIVWIYTVYPMNKTLEILYYCYPMSWVLSSTSIIIAYLIIRKKVNRQLLHETA